MQVFYTSPWIPAEWIKAHGFEPCGIWLDDDIEPPPLCAGTCAFAQWVAQLSKTQDQAAFIFSTHCDQMRRAFDGVVGTTRAPLFLFNLPATCEGSVARKIFGAELQRLGHFLNDLGGQPPSDARLREVMKDYEAARAPLSPGGQRSVVAQNYPHTHNSRAPTERCPPVNLALLGGPLPQSQLDLFDSIHCAGGRIVLDATEADERSVLPPLADQGLNAFDALVRLYTDGCVDVFQRPNTRLYAWLKERLISRQVRGIILWTYVNCDLWRAEASSLREAFGLPVLLLDADEAQSSSMRNITRIQAFLELLK